MNESAQKLRMNQLKKDLEHKTKQRNDLQHEIMKIEDEIKECREDEGIDNSIVLDTRVQRNKMIQEVVIEEQIRQKFGFVMSVKKPF